MKESAAAKKLRGEVGKVQAKLATKQESGRISEIQKCLRSKANANWTESDNNGRETPKEKNER